MTLPTISQHEIPKLIAQIKTGDAWRKQGLSSLTLATRQNLRIVLLGLHAQVTKPWHKVECAISVQVLEGQIEFHTKDQIALLKQGDLLVLQEGQLHQVKSLEESFILLTLALT